MLDVINTDVQLNMLRLGEQFKKNTPFPYLVIDGFFRSDFAQRLLDEFPRFDVRKATNEVGMVGGKAVNENLQALSSVYRELDRLFQSADFLRFVSGITGIPELLYDPQYVGGGTHENLHGQELDPHADFNYHPTYKWHRRLNLLIYLNPEWDESWGGCIELHADPWDADKNEVKAFAPLMNRCLIFETSERSWHGFQQIRLPEAKRHVSRKSIALYFYTRERPQGEIFPEHATFYVQRQLPERMRPGYTLTEEDLHELKVLLIRRDDWIKFLYQRELVFSQQLGDVHELVQSLPVKVGRALTWPLRVVSGARKAR